MQRTDRKVLGSDETSSSLVEELFATLARRAGLGSFTPTARAEAIIVDLERRGVARSPANLLGAAYEASIDAQSRRAGGIHYTPQTLVARVAERAFDAAGDLREERPNVIDPAMGAGAFLLAALRSIVGRDPRGDDVANRRAIATGSLFGIDADPLAVVAARRAIWLEVADPLLPLDAFDTQLVHADGLLDESLGDRSGLRWREAFARVFDLRGGFDVVLGNPPFLGGKRIRTVYGDAYAERLLGVHPGANKNVDLAAHFLRRGYDALRPGGVLGFVTTNTIAQGDTREGGLAHVLRNGATLLAADRSVAWPGAAGVVTSLLWLKRGPAAGPRYLDGVEVQHIDAFFSTLRADCDPARLRAMKRRAFIGCFLRGSGFVVDDDTKGASRVADVQAVLLREPQSAALVRPFMGGEEVLNHPRHEPHRAVIHFGARSLEEARAHAGLFSIVEANVRPFREARRATKADEAHRATWWRFANPRPELDAAIAGLAHVIVIPRMSAHVVAARVPTTTVFSDQLVVVASSSFAVFALLSSRVHEAWARFTCSTLGMGIRYTPSDAFETFVTPRPSFESLEHDDDLARAGIDFESARRAVLEGRGVGLSKLRRIIQRDTSADIVSLRRARDDLNRAVFSAYGWTDDPADVTDEAIVARLLSLNLERAHSNQGSTVAVVSIGSAQHRVPVE
ncbi:MAG: N-6 DNA methylase [Polyangiaceae bacterium]|nr:N-6 DNA methylase [Polyangiaceae bacterium]